MDSWILHALLVAGLVIHVSHARDPPEDDEDYNGDNSGDNSGNNSNEIESPVTTSVISLLTTSLEATPPKHSPTPNLSPGGKSHTGWLLLALGIVLLICTALLVSTITLACQVRKLRDQPSSVCPAHPPRVNADVIRLRKPSEVMETEMEKMMEEAENTAEKTLRVDADVQETEAAVVPTDPPADPSSDSLLLISSFLPLKD
ncbi:uncharacterized protein [Paramormyrops kingsleyae]|uniref:uncharacterized protein n=1 Tax=Paramormyrops kingsleyae TaxID=1676925 RepID=UPI003B97A9D3